TEWHEGATVEAGGITVAPVPLATPSDPGRPDPKNAAYVLDTLKAAVRLVRSGQAAALVTGPVHKGVINDSGVAFSGHTEYLAGLAGVPRVVMMLAADHLRVALVTTHLPLRDVPDAITTERVTETLRIVGTELRQRFGIPRGRIAVLGLNPHAGEDGHLGSEDRDIIAPAISACREEGIDALGPLPADTAFTPSVLDGCDTVLAMYHDQGLPVLKYAGFGRSVNITLGLPFIRTSVDHGTALDIAGQGIADASSFVHAADMALHLARSSMA
ncbi:MAG: 4-hydroxythreonine-4-phosphate dehydrogenase PdxA, partial [Xanthomonadales bacterium]|nr:4-hydroxythreonine-4-phosphate dehydrogenase PdxA [Xanthomonadales bacterium]